MRLNGAEEFLLLPSPWLGAAGGIPSAKKLPNHGLGIGEGLNNMMDLPNDMGAEEGLAFDGG